MLPCLFYDSPNLQGSKSGLILSLYPPVTSFPGLQPDFLPKVQDLHRILRKSLLSRCNPSPDMPRPLLFSTLRSSLARVLGIPSFPLSKRFRCMSRSLRVHQCLCKLLHPFPNTALSLFSVCRMPIFLSDGILP